MKPSPAQEGLDEQSEETERAPPMGYGYDTFQGARRLPGTGRQGTAIVNHFGNASLSLKTTLTFKTTGDLWFTGLHINEPHIGPGFSSNDLVKI